jgi:glycosyltransferase involved in cell wall biosynthesis
MKRILFAQFSLQPPGGGNGVAVWMLEALKDRCLVTVLALEKPDLDSINRYFGTALQPADFKLILANGAFYRVISQLPMPLAMLKAYYLYWRCRRVADQYDVAITADDEADMGACGIQYVHFPRFYPRRPAWDLKWYHWFRALLWAYYRIPRWLTGFSSQRMRRNLTLVNSEYTGRIFRAVHGTPTVTLYPPAIGEFPEIPWEQREAGFLSIGRISPEKRFEGAIDVLSRVRAAGFGVHLHLVGVPDDDAYTNFIRGLVQANAVWVSLHENLPRTQLLDLISTHRYGLHSMQDEPFGMAVAELLCGGCIPFVYNGGGQVEIVDHEPRLIYDSPADAAAKIIQTLRDPHLQMELREHLAQRKELFSAPRFVRQVRAIVTDPLAAPFAQPAVATKDSVRSSWS